MLTALVAATLLCADPATEQAELLKVFRGEFVQITPGQGKFPRACQIGSNDAGPDGAETPAMEVKLARPFWIAKYETTQNLWQAVMGANPSRWTGPRNSAEMLTREEARKFCRLVTQRMRAAKLIDADQEVRLPSEAEWEYCARAGTTTKFSWGDDATSANDYAWHKGNAAGNDPPVGAKKPNPWGLYDMHGYLREWCDDDWSARYQPAIRDGAPWRDRGAAQGVTRGGSWKEDARDLASGRRFATDLETRDDAIGLRCVLCAGRAVPEAGQFQPTAQADFIPADSKLELLWGEGEFTEGPALAPDGSIFFSDIGNAIHRFDPATKKTALFRQPSGRANGLMFDREGRLVACEGANSGGNRRISITTGIAGAKDGEVKTLSAGFDGKKFNSPNDLAIDARGNVYFTDPRYVGGEPRDLDFEAIFLVQPDGTTKIATREVQKPNGILVSPDGEQVYASDNNPGGNRHLAAFDIQADGALAGKKVLHDFGDGRGIDGMTLDAEGAIYAAAGTGEKAGIYVFGPSGKPLAFLPTPGDPTNCAFGGGDDGDSKTLYITSALGPTRDSKEPKYGLFRIKLAKRGFHVVKLKQP